MDSSAVNLNTKNVSYTSIQLKILDTYTTFLLKYKCLIWLLSISQRVPSTIAYIKYNYGVAVGFEGNAVMSWLGF